MMAPLAAAPGGEPVRDGGRDETRDGPAPRDDGEKIEVDLLLAGIKKRYGYDFTHYSHASLMRRLKRALEQARVARFTELLDRLLHDEKSFDDFLKHYRLADPALDQLAVIVRGTDTARLELAPQSAGLAAISLGLSRNFGDDHEMLRHGMFMYDALYAWCKRGQDEVHTWNPAAYR